MAKDIKEIIQSLEARLKTATLENDVQTTDELLADDWLNINATGTATTKQQTLAIMLKFRFNSIVNRDVTIRVYPGLAIVTGTSTRELEICSDTTRVSTVLFTRVYAQLGDRWQVVTSQATSAD